MWTDGSGFFYTGNCRDGDREATAEEVAIYEASKSQTLQQQIDAYVFTQSGGTIPNEIQLEGLMAGLLGGAAAQGYTEAQLLAANIGYQIGTGIRTDIAYRRANGMWPT